ncbi:MAG: putative lipid II flippase FtsW [Deltaproteobacteria bacterium]|nr:putative lipid II flippase FtsW [Deltaproteobacteria bacterium]
MPWPLLGRSKLESSRAALPEVIGKADAPLMAVVVGLVAFGVVMVYSASFVYARHIFDAPAHFLLRQAAFATLGVLLLLGLARVDYHLYRPLTYPLLGLAALLLMVVVFGLGHSAGGASRWISVGPVHVQPAEVAKLAIIFWMAYSLSKKQDRIRSFSVGFLPHVLMSGFLMLLCLKQPDFGSAVMIGLLTFVLLFTAGARLGYILGAVLMAAPLAWLLIATSPYRMRRIQAFLQPFQHRLDSGYQIAESLMTFGAGGVTGVGLGDSRQKLLFLPEAHTDFISAIIGEELGLVGVTCVVLAFGFIVWRGLRAAFRSVDDYGTYLAVGITIFVGAQAFTNLAVAMGMLPTKGLVLPFISYGGSSLLVNCAAVGVLLNVSRPRRRLPDDEQETDREPGRAKTGQARDGAGRRPGARANRRRSASPGGEV